jgi:putative thioredoxin
MSMTMPESGAAAAGANGALIKDTTTQAFAKDVLEASRSQPVLVDFWAPWCGPCKTLSPIIEKAVTDAKGAVRLVKMNIDDHPSVAGQLGIQSIPAVIAFQNGQPVDGFVGALPESQVKAFIERLAGPAGPSQTEALIEEGNRLLAEKDVAGAADHFAAALAETPQSVGALVGLASCQMAMNDLDAARRTLAAVPEKEAGAPEVVTLRAKLDLAAQTGGDLGDPAALEARIAANPKDHQARFDLALIENARGNREAAIDSLLEIVRRERSWNEEKARKQLVTFFEAWGPTDEATLSGRRRLSSVLFS